MLSQEYIGNQQKKPNTAVIMTVAKLLRHLQAPPLDVVPHKQIVQHNPDIDNSSSAHPCSHRGIHRCAPSPSLLISRLGITGKSRSSSSTLSPCGITSASLQCRNARFLDPCRPHVRAGASLSASALAAAVATSEEADDDAAEADNGADDGLEDAANTANDSHDGISDGLETRSDLLNSLLVAMFKVESGEAMVAYTRHNTAHFGCFVLWSVLGGWVWV